MERRQYHFFHHLPDDAVCQNNGRITVFESEFETQSDKVRHFLYGRGSERDQAVVAMSAAFDGLEIVCLAGLDCPQAGTATHHVHDQTGQFGSCDIRYTFLFQTDTGAGRGGHHTFARTSTSIYHIDGCHFTFSL